MHDKVVEEVELLEIVPADPLSALPLTVFNTSPTTLSEFFISDTAILSAFSSLEKAISDDTRTPAQLTRQSSEIYHSPFLMNFFCQFERQGKICFCYTSKISF